MLALDKLREVDGLTIGTLPDDVMEASAKAAREVMDEVAAGDDFMAKITKSFYDYAEKSSGYKQLYDEPFTRARAGFFG